jgi:hypothetical protein
MQFYPCLFGHIEVRDPRTPRKPRPILIRSGR